jgi:hypothetical protein
MKPLDTEYPMGDPNAATCRHCAAQRYLVFGKGILCRICDGAALAIATTNGARG